MKTKSSSRILARLLVVAMIVCSIAALPVVSFAEAETIALPSGYDALSYTHIYDGTVTDGSYSVYQNNTTSKYLLIIDMEDNATIGYQVHNNNLPTYAWCYLADGTTRIDTNTEEIIFLEGVKDIGPSVFCYTVDTSCVSFTSLKKITLPNSLQTIGADAFKGNTAITSSANATFEIVGGSGVKTLAARAFAHQFLSNINNFSSVEELGSGSLSFIAEPGTIVFPATLKDICYDSPTGTATLFSGGWSAISGQIVLDFSGCVNVVDFNMEDGARFGCICNHERASINMPERFTGFPAVGKQFLTRSAYTQKTITLHPYTSNELIKQVKDNYAAGTTVYPNGTNKIVLAHPTDATQIGTGSLYYKLLNNETELHIWGTGGYNAGQGADGDSNAKGENPNTTNVPWGQNGGDEKITKLVLHDGITSAVGFCTSNGSKHYDTNYTALKEVVLPDTLTELAADCFNGAPIEKVNLDADGLTTIKERAFNDNKLTEIVLSSAVKTIGSSALASTTLKRVFFENGASDVAIGGWAFHQCPLVYVQVPEGVNFTHTAKDPNGVFSGAGINVVFDFMGAVPADFKSVKFVTDFDANLFGADQAETMAAVAVTQPGVDIADEDWAVMDASLGFGVNLEGTASLAIVEKVEDVAAGEAVVINDSNAEKAYTAIYAAYDADGILVDAFVQSGRVDAFKMDTITASDVTEATTYKWFIWDGLTALKPYKAR